MAVGRVMALVAALAMLAIAKRRLRGWRCGYSLDSSSSDSSGGYGYGYDAAVSGPSYDGGISSSSESPEIRRPGRGVESGW